MASVSRLAFFDPFPLFSKATIVPNRDDRADFALGTTVNAVLSMGNNFFSRSHSAAGRGVRPKKMPTRRAVAA
jgi:hypothetical protein